MSQPPLAILPAPLCLTCQRPIFDMATSRDERTDEVLVVLYCHGATETVRIGAEVIASGQSLLTLGILAAAFEPVEPACGLAAGW